MYLWAGLWRRLTAWRTGTRTTTLRRTFHVFNLFIGSDKIIEFALFRFITCCQPNWRKNTFFLDCNCCTLEHILMFVLDRLQNLKLSISFIRLFTLLWVVIIIWWWLVQIGFWSSIYIFASCNWSSIFWLCYALVIFCIEFNKLSSEGTCWIVCEAFRSLLRLGSIVCKRN